MSLVSDSPQDLHCLSRSLLWDLELYLPTFPALTYLQGRLLMLGGHHEEEGAKHMCCIAQQWELDTESCWAG